MQSRFVMLFVGALLFAGVNTQAGVVSNNFADLRAELVSRTQILSNFVGQAGLSNAVKKVAVTQLKACIKSIQTIDKASVFTNSTALSKGLIAAGQVASTLKKPFATELSNTNTPVTVGDQQSQNNLRVLLGDVYASFVGNITDQIEGLDLDGLPAGLTAKIQAAIAKANAAIELAANETDFAKIAKFITNALKAATDAAKAAASGQNSGGGSTGGHGMSCKINGTSFSALGAGGVYVSITKQFSVTGATAQKGVTVFAFDVTGPGDYPMEGSLVTEIQTGVTYASNVTGTLHIATLNVGSHTATGTFSFTATQSMPTQNPSNQISVTQGTFNISTMIVY